MMFAERYLRIITPRWLLTCIPYHPCLLIGVGQSNSLVMIRRHITNSTVSSQASPAGDWSGPYYSLQDKLIAPGQSFLKR